MKVEISEERKRELDNLFHAFEIVSEYKKMMQKFTA